MVAAVGTKSVVCFVVVPSARQTDPLFVAVDLDRSTAFDRARAYLKTWNAVTRTGKAVLKRGTAELSWPARN